MKYFLLLFLGINLFATEIQEVKPIPVENIKYVEGLEHYSLFDVSQEGFKDYIEENKFNKATLETMYNRIDNPISITLSAYAYDYGHKRPDLAENFYKLFTDKFGFEHKLRYADFLIRTGRASAIENLFKKMECIINIKRKNECTYYKGLAKYLLTGDNKNKELRSVRKKVPKAEEIYSMN